MKIDFENVIVHLESKKQILMQRNLSNYFKPSKIKC